MKNCKLCIIVEDITTYRVRWKNSVCRIGEDGDAGNTILEPAQTSKLND
jgi:hypothetical protein